MTGQTDRRTDGRQAETLLIPLDAASVTIREAIYLLTYYFLVICRVMSFLSIAFITYISSVLVQSVLEHVHCRSLYCIAGGDCSSR